MTCWPFLVFKSVLGVFKIHILLRLSQDMLLCPNWQYLGFARGKAIHLFCTVF